jgi:hypothetical protein
MAQHQHISLALFAGAEPIFIVFTISLFTLIHEAT